MGCEGGIIFSWVDKINEDQWMHQNLRRIENYERDDREYNLEN
jgi:hypothetical protein